MKSIVSIVSFIVYVVYKEFIELQKFYNLFTENSTHTLYLFSAVGLDFRHIFSRSVILIFKVYPVFTASSNPIPMGAHLPVIDLPTGSDSPHTFSKSLSRIEPI